MKIGIVAGEDSGDQLGAGLISAIKKNVLLKGIDSDFRAPSDELTFTGVGGQRMLAEGFESIAPMEILSVMGLIEPLKRLPSLLRLRRKLFRHFVEQKVDIVIGIDSPDFNLGLERRLKKAGITTCHYVCPSVWAWRQGRVKKIRESVDHVLTLLPFEQAFLAKAGVPSTFVGHPVADKFLISQKVELNSKPTTERRSEPDSHYCEKTIERDLGVEASSAGGSTAIDALQAGSSLGKKQRDVSCEDPLTIVVMPGSRHSELDRLLALFLDTIRKSRSKLTAATFLMPASNPDIRDRICQMLQTTDYRDLSHCVTVLEGQSHEAIAKADIVLLASGTAALEAGLLGKPMLVAYRLNWLTYQIAKKLVKVDRFSLPNLLLEKPVVPEFIQDDATAEALADGLASLALDSEKRSAMSVDLQKLLPMLAQDANETSARVTLSLVEKRL